MLDPAIQEGGGVAAARGRTAPSDRLDGVNAIAIYLGCTIDAVYYARRVGSLPIRRLGRKGALYAFKTELDAAQKADSTLPANWQARRPDLQALDLGTQ